MGLWNQLQKILNQDFQDYWTRKNITVHFAKDYYWWKDDKEKRKGIWLYGFSVINYTFIFNWFWGLYFFNIK